MEAEPNPKPIEKPEVPPAEAGSPPVKKKRWRWLRVIGVLFALLIVLVVLIPTIAGLSFVRSIVISRVNDNLNGHIEIDDWSLGWTGGVVAKGIRIFDTGGTKIASIDRMATQQSLIGAIRGNYHLGKTSVEGL